MIISPSEHHVLFDHFPATGYRQDVLEIRPRALERHGEQEWRAITLTAEMHGHLGIFAVLGVKMGLAALEHFASMEEPLHLLSYAGTTPPLSCMNDGLQVATGATLGHGQICISKEGPARVMALFQRSDKALRLRLKADYDTLLKSELEEMVKQCGRRTPSYWLEMRKMALRWWLEWDRHQIFATEYLEPKKDFE
jgi:pyrimidine-specific ribonucleoside hydrolase